MFSGVSDPTTVVDDKSTNNLASGDVMLSPSKDELKKLMLGLQERIAGLEREVLENASYVAVGRQVSRAQQSDSVAVENLLLVDRRAFDETTSRHVDQIEKAQAQIAALTEMVHVLKQEIHVFDIKTQTEMAHVLKQEAPAFDIKTQQDGHEECEYALVEKKQLQVLRAAYKIRVEAIKRLIGLDPGELLRYDKILNKDLLERFLKMAELPAFKEGCVWVLRIELAELQHVVMLSYHTYMTEKYFPRKNDCTLQNESADNIAATDVVAPLEPQPQMVPLPPPPLPPASTITKPLARVQVVEARSSAAFIPGDSVLQTPLRRATSMPQLDDGRNALMTSIVQSRRTAVLDVDMKYRFTFDVFITAKKVLRTVPINQQLVAEYEAVLQHDADIALRAEDTRRITLLNQQRAELDALKNKDNISTTQHDGRIDIATALRRKFDKTYQSPGSGYSADGSRGFDDEGSPAPGQKNTGKPPLPPRPPLQLWTPGFRQPGASVAPDSVVLDVSIRETPVSPMKPFLKPRPSD